MTGRVLHLCDELCLGGTQRMICHLASHLQAMGEWEQAVQHPRTPAADPWLTECFEGQGIRLFPGGSDHRYSALRLRVLWRLTAAHRFDILHTHGLDALRLGLLVRWLRPGLKLVHTQHMAVVRSGFPTWGLWQRLLAPRADALCVVSPALEQEYRRLGVVTARVIPNGIPSQRPRTLRSDFIRAHGLTADPAAVWLLALGRLEPRKGQRHLLDLWCRWEPELRRRLWLFLVGPESVAGERAHLARQIRSLPDGERVTLSSATHDPLGWLSVADVCVCPSESEGMPLVALEALACHTPLLVSDIPGHDFLGEAARRFPLPITGPEAATWLSELADDPAGARASFAHSTAALRARHGVTAMAKSYANVYASLKLHG